MRPASFLRWLAISIALHVTLVASASVLWPLDRFSIRQASTSLMAVTLVDAVGSSPPPRVQPPAPPASPETSRVQLQLPASPTIDVGVPKHAPVPDPEARVAPADQPGPTDKPVALAPGILELRFDDAGAEPSTDDPAPAVGVTDDLAGSKAAQEQYRPLVLAILERAKRYPLFAQRRGLEGTVEIAFTIAPDGRISESEVITTSRHGLLDEATLDMIRRVGSLPPPPDQSPLRFAARIQYLLDPTTSLASTKGAVP